MKAAGLGEEVLHDNEAAEAKLHQLRRWRAEQATLHLKSTTSGATTRDVQLVACRVANRLCLTLDGEGGIDGGGERRGLGGILQGELSRRQSVAVALASGGGVAAVTLLFRMFEALDIELMMEALSFALALARGCASMPVLDDSSSETPSLAAPQILGSEEAAKEQIAGPPLLPSIRILRALYAPSVCRKIAEIAKQFPHSSKVQKVFCLLVGELGFSCGRTARWCFAECCEPTVAAVQGNLDKHVASTIDESSMHGGSGELSQGVTEAACQTLAILAQEPGLSRRLVAAGAGQAITRAMEAAPLNNEIQLRCLETLTLLTESSPDMWNGCAGDRAGDASTPSPIDAPCRRAVESIQTFVRDTSMHLAASRAVLALLTNDTHGNAARSVSAAGGVTALSRVLATSPINNEVQLPAVLAIAALLEGCAAESVLRSHVAPGEVSTALVAPLPNTQKVEHELVAAAGCELLSKSAKTFPRDRDLRLGCLRAMSVLCRGTKQVAVMRLVDSGMCEQVTNNTRYSSPPPLPHTRFLNDLAKTLMSTRFRWTLILYCNGVLFSNISARRQVLIAILNQDNIQYVGRATRVEPIQHGYSSLIKI